LDPVQECENNIAMVDGLWKVARRLTEQPELREAINQPAGRRHEPKARPAGHPGRMRDGRARPGTNKKEINRLTW
jgi:hypothetical protein